MAAMSKHGSQWPKFQTEDLWITCPSCKQTYGLPSEWLVEDMRVLDSELHALATALEYEGRDAKGTTPARKR